MALEIARGEDEVNDLLNSCSDAEEEGLSKYPGMTYEQGVSAAINWILGDNEDHPLEA